MKTIFLSLILTAPALLGADDNATKTLGMMNGHFWIMIPAAHSLRETFVLGLLDGWKLRGDTSDTTSGAVVSEMSVGGAQVADD
jgi:hypothetical protein